MLRRSKSESGQFEKDKGSESNINLNDNQNTIEQTIITGNQEEQKKVSPRSINRDDSFFGSG